MERDTAAADGGVSHVAQLDALTGSRFVAAYAILVLHGTAFGYTLPAWLNLSQAVSYFFVLSGFILGYRYPHLRDRRAVLRFYGARFARIWPVHFFCLMLSLTIVPSAFWSSADAIGWSILPLQILLVNAWIPIERFVFGFNAVAWTISVEWFFYALYPLLIFRWTATWHWKLACAALLTLALAWLSTVVGLPAAAPADRPNQVSSLALLYGNPLARLFEFSLGMTMALAWHRYHDRMRLPSMVATALELALIAAIAADLYWCGLRAPEWAAALGPAFDWRVLTSTSLGTGACFLYAPLILLLASGRGLVTNLLARRLPVILGESSYALYMLQYVMLVPVIRNPQWLEGWNVLVRVAIGYSIIIAAALLLWYCFERPARRWLLATQSGIRSASVPASTRMRL
jgi:peptidoglycan/LPS O-acetylase OafA/YrhL